MPESSPSKHAEDPIRLLALDDQAATLQAYRWVFGSPAVWSAPNAEQGSPEEGVRARNGAFELLTCEHGADAIAAVQQGLAEERPFTVLFISPLLGTGEDGVATAVAIRAADPDINIVVVASPGELRPERFEQSIEPPEKLLYFPKPFQPHVLRHLASTLGAKWRAEQQLQHSHKQLEDQVKERTQELRVVNQLLIHDISRREEVEAALVESRERYALAARAANDALWDWDILEDRLYLSERWFLMLGLEPDRHPDQPGALVRARPPRRPPAPAMGHPGAPGRRRGPLRVRASPARRGRFLPLGPLPGPGGA